MALKQGTLTHLEQEAREGSGPRVAYLMDHPTVPGRYILGVGSKAGEATAFLKASPIASALGRFVLDDDITEEDRALYLMGGTTRVIA